VELVDLLVKNLGVEKGQAESGAGSIFNMVKEQLGSGDFAKLTTEIPEIGNLTKAAPKAEKSGGGGLLDMVGSLASAVGGDSQLGKLGKLAQLGGVFEKLGLDPEMVARFLPIILEFVEKKGGSSLQDLLKGALGTEPK
jgi:hypothetical protein